MFCLVPGAVGGELRRPPYHKLLLTNKKPLFWQPPGQRPGTSESPPLVSSTSQRHLSALSLRGGREEVGGSEDPPFHSPPDLKSLTEVVHPRPDQHKAHNDTTFRKHRVTLSVQERRRKKKSSSNEPQSCRWLKSRGGWRSQGDSLLSAPIASATAAVSCLLPSRGLMPRTKSWLFFLLKTGVSWSCLSPDSVHSEAAVFLIRF